jgi:hypothetical protein
MISRLRAVGSAVSLLGFPLMFFVFWLLYPAYGKLSAPAIIGAIAGHATATTVADAFGYLGTLLAIPASFALMRELESPAPKLARFGGWLSVVGFWALAGAQTIDPVAVAMVSQGPPSADLIEIFGRYLNGPVMLGLNVLTMLHIVGGVVLGAALVRSHLIPGWAAWAAAVAPIVHFASNVAGLLWIDELTWIAVAVAYGFVARRILRNASEEPRAS